MLYLESPKQTAKTRIEARRDTLNRQRFLTRRYPDYANLYEDTIPSGPTIYLPAATDTQINEESAMDTPMFKDESSEVTVKFNEYGTIEVTFSRYLTKQQIQGFCYGVASVSGVARAELVAAPTDRTDFDIVLRAHSAKRAFDIRANVASYARDFVERLIPAVEQVSLF